MIKKLKRAQEISEVPRRKQVDRWICKQSPVIDEIKEPLGKFQATVDQSLKTEIA